MNVRKWTSVVLALTLVFCLLPKASAADPAPENSATSAIVIDAYTGQVIYEKNADEQRPIASVTKVMTAYLATQDVALDDPKLDQIYTVSQFAADSDEDGTSMYFLEGDQVSFEVLLYGTMLRSGNDAAVALAEACSEGDYEAFLQKMNDTAAELGMENTHYSCANGLIDEDNYSTARDQAKLAKVAMENPLFAKVCGIRYIELGSYQIENHNQLVSIMKGECLGIKTGFTTLAGRTLVTCAERDGSRFIVVTLNDNDDYADHQALYEWAFANYPANVLCVKNDTVTTLRIGSQEVPLVASETVVSSVSVSSESSVECWYDLPAQFNGAAAKGSVAGTATYVVNGEVIAEVELLYGELVVT